MLLRFFILCCFILLLSFHSSSVLAIVTTQEFSTEATQQADKNIHWLEKTRKATYNFTFSTVRAVDNWFGELPFEENGGKVSGNLRLRYLWKQTEGSNITPRFRLQAHLPNTKDKAYVFIGRDNKQEELKDQPENLSREQLLQSENSREEDSFFAGVGYLLAESIELRLGVHNGWKGYVQARYQTDWSLTENTRFIFRESIFWSIYDHLGSTSVLNLEHQLKSDLLIRWSNSGTITQRSSTFSWYSSISLHQSYSEQRFSSIEYIIKGRTKDSALYDYGVNVSWGQPIYKTWLRGKFTLGHFWPKKREERRTSWAIGASVDLLF